MVNLDTELKNQEFPEMVCISKEKYNALLKAQAWLNCLKWAGVDNWEGYDYALDIKRTKFKEFFKDEYDDEE